MNRSKCPDCNSVAINFFEKQGDGKCDKCLGQGLGDLMDQFATTFVPDAKSRCLKCNGTGQCQTCGGTGFVHYEDSYTQHYDSSPKSSESSHPSEAHVSSSPSDTNSSSYNSSPTDSTTADYSSYGSATSSSSTAGNSPDLAWLGWVVATIVIVVGGALGVQWYMAHEKEAADRAREKDKIRQAEASRAEITRIAEGARAKQAFPGKWHYWNRDDGRQAELRILCQGDRFSGEYRSGERLELLSGQLQTDNRLRLVNTRQYGKLVPPGTWYVGDFSQESWLQLGNDSTVLFVSFSPSGPTFVMNRSTNGAGSVRRR